MSLSSERLEEIFTAQRNFFLSGATANYNFRIESLRRLASEVKQRQKKIIEALWADFRKPEAESLFSETSLVLQEIAHCCKNLKRWMQPKRVRTPVLYFLSNSFVYREPVGNVLVISPWNYPLQLPMYPLISAIAAGNCVILKPSEMAVNTYELLQELLSSCFASEHVQVVNLAGKESEKLLALPFNHVHFTGSIAVGKIVAQKVAETFTPVTLELGGKCPCIVDENVPLVDTAKRLVWAKFFNCGQSCLAPDYLLVHENIKSALLAEIKKTIVAFYGKNTQTSTDYARIINDKQHARLVGYLQDGEVVFGGEYEQDTRYFAPTLLENCALDSKIMREEIFGPLLPVFSFKENKELTAFIANVFKNPLAMYVFSKSSTMIAYLQQQVACGSCFINDALLHYGVPDLPFGGREMSGIGKGHGKHGFYALTHPKAVMKRAFGFDLRFRFPPYKYMWMLRKILSFFVRGA